MPNNQISNESQFQTAQFSKTHQSDSEPTRLYQKGYQQALNDFAITDLLTQLRTYSDTNSDIAWDALEQQEFENLAAILIQSLIANLNSKLIADHLKALRHEQPESSSLCNLQLTSPLIDLPSHFPNVEMPHFSYGDRLRWIAEEEETDSGIIIGRFYSFAPHKLCWMWGYLILLDSSSPSSTWVSADVAWEDDLECLQRENTE